MKRHTYKWCVVPECISTSIKTPNKLFIRVPLRIDRRAQWLKLAGRDFASFSRTSALYLCEDHFDLEHDTTSFMQYRLGGSLQTVVRLKPDCVPTKFMCKSDVNTPQRSLLKAQNRNVMVNEECVNEHAESSTVSVDTSQDLLLHEDNLSESSDTMADDIDIEEHDVLDNPAIRNIFPDLTVIKQEIASYEGDSEIVDQYQFANSLQEASDINVFQNVHIDNEISLKEEDEAIDIVNNPYANSLDNLNQSTKIILGSKPKIKLDYAEFEENVNSYELKLQLLDMKPYLERSERFCRQCLILFPNKQSFEMHVKENHSFIEQKIEQKVERKAEQKLEQKNRFKTPIYCLKCNIKFTAHASLIRHCRNFHMENQNQKNNSIEKKVQTNMKRVKKSDSSGSHACFHCKKEFLTQQSLIQHLYKVIQFRTQRCSFCSKKFSNKADFDHHMLEHKEKNSTVEDHLNSLHKDVNDSDVELLEETQTDEDLSKDVKEPEIQQDSKTFEYVAVETKKRKEIFNSNIDFYRCHICHYYFKDAKFCLEHLAIEHNVTCDTNTLKPVEFDSFCHLCQRKYNDMSVYNCHISLFHNNDIDQRKTDASQMPRSLGTSMKDEHLLKSTLFRCTRCDIHFLSAEVARNHKGHMEMLSHWKCTKCMRFFKKEDEWRHIKQHVFPNLTVYDLCPDSQYLVLFNCLKCTVHFNENGFVKHYSKCCESETPSAVYCRYCDLLIDEAIGKSHKASHEIGNIKIDNITIVNSNVMTISNQLSQQPITLKHSQYSQDRKNAYKIRDEHKQKELKKKCNGGLKDPQKTMKRNWNSLCELIYCDTCKLFLISRFTRNIHIKGRCRYLRKCVCKVCGLVFPSQHYKTHKRLHSRRKSCNLQNFEFYNMSGKLISPPIPEYPKCEKCDLVTVSRPAGCRDCNKVDYLTCNLCEMRLTEEAFKLHMLFHNFTKIRSADGPNNAPEQLSSEWNLDEEETTKLIEQNLLFECKNCNMNVNTYDKAVEHSQAHYSGEWKNIETVKCEFCDKIFDKTCYEKHQKCHLSHSDTIHFKIFYFDSVYLTSENSVWLTHVFGSLSQTETNAIISKSIYKSECRIKMKVIQDGPPNFTVYKCDKCCSYIDESSLYKHADNSCFKLRKHHCSICNLPFISSFARTQHEQIHTDPNIGWKSYRNYRIVIFNKEEDNKINKLLYSRSQYYILYRCRNCHASVDEVQTRNHKCNSRRLKCCKMCGVLIEDEHFESHMERHKELTNFTQNKIKVILFGDISKTPTGETRKTDEFIGIVCDYTLFCCKRCQVTLTTVQPPSKHTCSTNTVKTKCDICDLYFYQSTLKRHSKLHVDDLEFVRENMRIIKFDLSESGESNSKDGESTHTVATKSIKLGDGESTHTVATKSIKLGDGESTHTVATKSIKLGDGESTHTVATKSIKLGDGESTHTVATKSIKLEDGESTHTVATKSIKLGDGESTHTLATKSIKLGDGESTHTVATKSVKLGDEKQIADTVDDSKKSITKVGKEIVEKKAKIYKCNCGLHFLNRVSMLFHSKTCSPKIRTSKQNCFKCGLLFTSKSLFSHLLIHHGNQNQKYRFEIVNCTDVLNGSAPEERI